MPRPARCGPWHVPIPLIQFDDKVLAAAVQSDDRLADDLPAKPLRIYLEDAIGSNGGTLDGSAPNLHFESPTYRFDLGELRHCPAPVEPPRAAPPSP